MKKKPVITESLMQALRTVYDRGEGFSECSISRTNASKLAKLEWIITKVTKVYAIGSASKKLLYIKTTHAGREALHTAELAMGPCAIGPDSNKGGGGRAP